MICLFVMLTIIRFLSHHYSCWYDQITPVMIGCFDRAGRLKDWKTGSFLCHWCIPFLHNLNHSYSIDSHPFMAFTPLLHATISQFTHRIPVVGHWGSSPRPPLFRDKVLGTAKAMWLCPRVEFKSTAFSVEATRWLIIVGGLLWIAKDGDFLLLFVFLAYLSSCFRPLIYVPVMVGWAFRTRPS